ncbi:SulP family inorganic anion transporter [Mycolicibacterium sp. HS_4_1]
MRGATQLTARFHATLLSSLRGYRRSWVAGDLGAAMTLLAIAVPEQLATARLAGIAPLAGLYAFVAGTVLFALLGSNPQMSVGADSTIAPLFATGIAVLASPGSADYAALASIVAVLVGVTVGLVGALRLGWVAEFLSAPIISGFLGGVAVIIAVHQLPDLMGLPAASGNTVHRARVALAQLGQINGWALAIAVAGFAVVVVAALIDRRLPGALVALVGSTILVRVLDLPARGVEVLGPLAHGSPHDALHVMSWSTVNAAAPIAGVVALVVVSQTAATTRAFADQGGYQVNVNRDFLGVGAGNVVAGLIGAFPVNASPPRTAAVVAASGRTQLTGLVAAAAVAALIPAVALLADVPVATLAAILLFIAIRILPLRDLIDIARYDRFEFALALLTLFTVAVVGVEQGIAVAVGLAILDRTRLSARPHIQILGRIPSTTSWAPLSATEHAAEIPGVLVVLFATPLWYANAGHFRAQMSAAINRGERPPQLVVLDTVGMTDIDYTGSRTLRQLLDELDHRGAVFAMARTSKTVHAALARSGLLARMGEDHLFSSVGEAVEALRPGNTTDRPGAQR